MALDLSQIRREVQQPSKRAVISRAIAHQNRIKFHVQKRMTPLFTLPVMDFLSWVQTLIPDDKFKIFKTMFRYPVITNEITDVVFDKLSRIFEGRNPAMNYQFMSTAERDDWEDYRQRVLDEPNVWQTKAWEYFKTEVNSVLIVDMPREQVGPYPAPYFYWLTIDHVISYETDPTTGQMAWIIFTQPDDCIAVIDETSYRVFKAKNNELGEMIMEAPHDLGYCPARFFWNVPISIEDPDVKQSPVTKELEALDWYLFFHISKRHLDLYGAYPIYSGYEQSCTYSNQANGDHCDGGYIKDANNNYKYDTAGQIQRCPICGDKRIAGAGSFVEIPIPSEDQPDLRNPVQMLTADTASLQYNVSEVARLKEEIITGCVGTPNDTINTEAVNEMQVEASFESQTTVLNRVKRGFEAAQQFIDETVCRLRYGALFISAKVNLGTEFYLANAEELRARYKTARESGASEAELDAMQNQILESEYRNNPTQLQRMLILADLEPYRHLTWREVVDMHTRNIVSEEDMKIKMNFADYVRRFERENTNVIEFGADIPYTRKIQIITDEFKRYAQNQ